MRKPRLSEVFVAKKRSIVVSIPKGKRREIEAEEAEVSRREAAGERDISYYWQMGRLPKDEIDRIYFAWDGAVRAYHEVIRVDDGEKRIYMKTKICQVERPVPMESFRSFRYFEGDR